MASEMQIEAQRLVSISLSKMAQSRSQRTGISLHKSLLLATVLQKARFLCMEEVFRMVHPSSNYCNDVQQENNGYYDDNLIGLTPEEAGIETNNDNNAMTATTTAPLEQTYEYNNYSEYDKENVSPQSAYETVTYFDLDNEKSFKDKSYLRKRRRTTSDSDENESKKCKSSSSDSDSDEEYSDTDEYEDEPKCEKPMDIERITSLVSIFSFGGLSASTSGSTCDSGCNGNHVYTSMTRSSSTPDLCSAQANQPDSLQQRRFLAMTV